ncbi:MAG: tRNA (guanosine(37)-N1)-methyltransferase TrmD [Parcubacteria group bacterium]|nr:tRNA (guanosine(37)-N1)-methyltransferase TrmD [Parcubacteria group bacterium]
MIEFHILTLFPDAFSYLRQSILKRAEEKKKIIVKVHNLRDFARDKHQITDDKPYGGGAGMVMKAEPIVRAVESITKRKGAMRTRVVLLSAKGKQFTQKRAHTLANGFDRIILIAGRYEGVDERVKTILKAEEVSVGPYVLTDGDVASMIIVSAVARLIPGVITLESLKEESFFNTVLKGELQGGVLEYPHYTRPEVLEHAGKKYRVPKVLLSGDHKKIEEWRRGKRK